MPSGHKYSENWKSPLANKEVPGVFSFTLHRSVHFMFINTVDADHSPRFAASNLDVHCLPISLLQGTTALLSKLIN